MNAPAPGPHDIVLRLMSGAWMTQALYAASELDLAERLAKGPRTAADLASACGAPADRVERLLRTLASEGVFRRRDDGRYENTDASETFRSGVANSLRPALKMTAEEHYLGWSRFLDCVKSGKTAFELHFGEPVFDWYAEHEAAAANFQKSMQAFSATQIPAIAAACDVAAATRIVDVGGGHGALLLALLAKAPQARGVVFDLEQGLAAARAAGLDRNPRVELVAGDFFKALAPGGDVYVMKYILHDWDDDRCVTILSNCRKAMARGGRVLVCDQIVGPPNQPDPAKWMDLHMMAMPGGTERSREEFERLFVRAGLKLLRVVPTASEMSILEAG